ncbi:hypothetical protein WL29_22815 [Burkholderia ubonensis]|uniref:Uncharacterized protein n=1 Tax=Burkholderia ubonensis TaxID=101571 RepID=A0A119HFN9_9BURK|nr:hypothetical protein [Burkholderia ubonensis]KWA84196.1 hypothetical protein WL29_22815 [Burkholderia ubonensis]
MADAHRDLLPAVTGPFPANSLLLLHLALQWWQLRGFQYVDLPWMVPTNYADAHRPDFCRDVPTLHGSFVGSGEQSFLMLHEEDRLPAGAPGYIGWTPCLRDEVLDETHQHGFMKAEWFVPLTEADISQWRRLVLDLMGAQESMFRAVALAGIGVPRVGMLFVYEQSGPEQIDLVLNGLEVGSYGLRRFNGRPYLYGTALALPRFTQALERGAALVETNPAQESLNLTGENIDQDLEALGMQLQQSSCSTPPRASRLDRSKLTLRDVGAEERLSNAKNRLARGSAAELPTKHFD